MKKFLCSLLFAAVPVMTVMAQTAPKHFSLNIEEFAYKPSATSKALTVLSVVSSSSGLWLPDKSMMPQMNEAVVSGAVNIPWIDSADQSTADYTLKGHYTQMEVSTGKPESIIVRARTTLIDNRTGKEVATKIVVGASDVMLTYENTATRKLSAAYSLARHMKWFLFEALPVTGRILEKGVEQANGKVKEKQCYVDLGEIHGVEKDMMLYVVENGKYKAELRVVEVMGEDLCTCKIVKGDSYVTKSMENGVVMNVTSQPKKIDSVM